jgi:D-lactate dehydrogenase (cytochrome)
VRRGSGTSSAVLGQLGSFLGDRLSTSDSIREQHGRDESPLTPEPPDAVVFPESTEEVAKILATCSTEGVPVIPFGAGTSLEGHVLARHGGISLDLTRMNNILVVRPDDLDATVQAGVTRKQLNARLARDGLFFPVDPGADATLGGMAATGASGTTTVRYGAMRENVLNLEVVLADGRVVKTAHRARKSSAGYDLTRLMVGSEGTLGVITEVTLRVRGIPEAISAAVCQFPDMEKAVRAVIAIMQLGIPVARIEFMDELAIVAINSYKDASYPVAPLLLFEFHGSSSEVTEQTGRVRDVVDDFGALHFESAMEGKQRTDLWTARHESFYATLSLRPGSKAVTTDVCVPISQLADCIVRTKADLVELGLTATIVGHVGDGNFHVQMLIDPGDSDEVSAAEELNHRLVERAISMEGTCTGEHGIGLRKVDSLMRELPHGVEVMRSLKKSLDPNGILNPGKVLRVAESGSGNGENGNPAGSSSVS